MAIYIDKKKYTIALIKRYGINSKQLLFAADIGRSIGTLSEYTKLRSNKNGKVLNTDWYTIFEIYLGDVFKEE